MNRYPLRPALFVFFFFLASLVAAASPQSDDGVVKILAIGNSFSADAIENNLWDLASEKGIKTVVANLYIGGAPLHLHVTNARENKPAYSYRKTDVAGNRTTVTEVSLEKALADEDWDYVSFQQASPLSGQFKTVADFLPELAQYVRGKLKNPNAKFIYHQTWAYSEHAVHPGFANYDRDQRKMYQAIVDVSKQVHSIAPIDIVIPAGTAIQNARTSYIGDNFDRDGYHLRFSLGRYVAACTWFEKIFGVPVIGLKYKPADVTETEKLVAQYAAHYAVEKPYEVTPLKKFRKGPKPLKKPAAAVLVDFGGVSHEGVWNPIVSPLAGKIHPLRDSLLNPTRIALEMVKGFEGKNSDGDRNPVPESGFPGSVTNAGYFGKGGQESQFRLTGLDKKSLYDISFYAARDGENLGVLETSVVCEGAEKTEAIVNIANKSSRKGNFQGVRPAADGTITLTVKAGPRNGSEGFYCISALRLEAK